MPSQTHATRQRKILQHCCATTFCTRLVTVQQRIARCWIVLGQVWNWSNFCCNIFGCCEMLHAFGQLLLHNIWLHDLPMLQDVALQFCVRLTTTYNKTAVSTAMYCFWHCFLSPRTVCIISKVGLCRNLAQEGKLSQAKQSQFFSSYKNAFFADLISLHALMHCIFWKHITPLTKFK